MKNTEEERQRSALAAEMEARYRGKQNLLSSFPQILPDQVILSFSEGELPPEINEDRLPHVRVDPAGNLAGLSFAYSFLIAVLLVGEHGHAGAGEGKADGVADVVGDESKLAVPLDAVPRM